jgi:hypothetical protein
MGQTMTIPVEHGGKAQNQPLNLSNTVSYPKEEPTQPNTDAQAAYFKIANYLENHSFTGSPNMAGGIIFKEKWEEMVANGFNFEDVGKKIVFDGYTLGGTR